MLECKCVISIVDSTNLEEQRSKSNWVKFEREGCEEKLSMLPQIPKCLTMLVKHCMKVEDTFLVV